MDLRQLESMFAALIDTAERTTDLSSVYNDKNDTSHKWVDVRLMQQHLRTKIIMNELQVTA